MALTQSEYEKLLGGTSSGATKDKDIGLTKSILSGVGSGVFKIFEGAATLGATLMDLGVDKNRAEAVEEYFDNINPFDEAAEATAAGKITELIVNIGIPGGVAFKVGSGLTKATLRAKQAGKYLSANEKFRRFGKGALAGGVAEGAFVGDVEDAGTFGDFLGGPTTIERDTSDPTTELLNRFKFGVEGALFTGAIGAAGRTVSKLRNQAGTGKAITGEPGTFEKAYNKFIDKYISKPLRARGPEVEEAFDEANRRRGLIAKDQNRAENAMIKIENITNQILKNFKRTGNKVDNDVRKELLKDMNNILTDNNNLKPLIDESGVVSLKSIDKETEQAFKNKLITKYNANSADVEELFKNFNKMRSTWSELFTLMGTRLTSEALKDFQTVIPGAINDILDRGYEVFKNNPMSVADNYPPTKAIIDEAVTNFQREAAEKGVTLTDDVAKNMVNEVWNNAELPKGILLSSNSKSGVVRLASVPDFFVKSVADDIIKKPIGRMKGGKNLSDLTGVGQEIIKKLLGKAQNPMSTIVEGTNALSAQVRLNQYLDSMVKRSNRLKVEYDKWLAGGKVGPEPRVPFLVDSPGEARKYFGSNAQLNVDFKLIAPVKGGIESTPLGRFTDQRAKIKPVDDIEAARLEAMDMAEEITNPIIGKYALTDQADALIKTQESAKGLPAQLYQNLVLYPKATSQMAKTILAPFTHMRNFISAAAFAAANGIVPFGNTQDVRRAFDALQVGDQSTVFTKGFRKDNEFYQELLELGVVNSQVQVGDLRRLLEDVDFGGTLNRIGADYNGFNTFMKGLNKLKKFSQDAYTAEDDFWKIFTFLGEQSRLKNAYRNAGLREGQEIKQVLADGTERVIGTFNEDFIKRQAANLVKNNVPNYAFVSEFVKGLRKLPVGNFVAFPAEILRTGTNIVDTALDEIFFTANINGKIVNPLRTRGLQRLGGMAFTTAALPLSLVSGFQALYDVSKDELDAMKRYVPEWSKNSILIPFKDKEGKLSYIDFSHLNAYDTLTRPIQTVINAVESGRGDKDGIMDDFILGLIDSTKELGSPFISESIWTEALQDVAPILGRAGRTADGREIYSNDPRIDPIGSRVYKSLAHLIEAQAPLNWKQLGRLGLAMKPIDDFRRFDERGNQYDLGNELLGIAGLRRIEVDPRKSLNFKITDFKKGIRESRNLFTRATLKGGPVTPEEIVDAFVRSNRALYEVNRDMYQDIQSAKILGMSEDAIFERMQDRGERKAFNALNDGDFRPFFPSKDTRQIFEIKAAELGVANPYEAVEGILERIREVLSETPLESDLFPDIENPFRGFPKPTLGPLSQLPNVITGADPAVMNANQNFVQNALNQAQNYQALNPFDELGNLYNQQKLRETK
tara:strand:- start:13 stop:4116 length:4104 start_codon:yes stop_codon:yes gene_type:complete